MKEDETLFDILLKAKLKAKKGVAPSFFGDRGDCYVQREDIPLLYVWLEAQHSSKKLQEVGFELNLCSSLKKGFLPPPPKVPPLPLADLQPLSPFKPISSIVVGCDVHSTSFPRWALFWGLPPWWWPPLLQILLNLGCRIVGFLGFPFYL